MNPRYFTTWKEVEHLLNILRTFGAESPAGFVEPLRVTFADSPGAPPQAVTADPDGKPHCYDVSARGGAGSNVALTMEVLDGPGSYQFKARRILEFCGLAWESHYTIPEAVQDAMENLEAAYASILKR